MADIPSRVPSTNEMGPPDDGRPERFDAWDPRLLTQIDALLKQAEMPGPHADHSDLAREMIVTVLKAQHSGLDRGDMKILNRALRELRYGFRIFKPFRDRRKVTIFGSARTPMSDASYKQAKAFAREMAKRGFMIITGAGPGIMRAGNEGAGKDNSFGINIRLPYEQAANEFIAKNSLFIDCRFFFTRKLMFLKETSAVAFFPGGFGTHDEGMETLTLIQTGKCDPMPVVFLDVPASDYWKDWKRYVVKHLLNKGKVSPEDMHLFKVTDSVEEAADEISGFYRNYHSMRYVKDRLVIRMKKPASPSLLEALNTDFRALCLKGGFSAGGALPEETDHRDLPRLMFNFNRINFGRLRQLIDRLNAAGV
jgi:uncharacterized protein (TIGR00730 family)